MAIDSIASQSKRLATNSFPGLPSPEEVATRLLNRLAFSEPPVPLAKLIGLWKDLEVVEEDIDGPGYLLPLGKLGAEIIIKKDDDTTRKRFTLAHELGHWVLGLTCEKKLGQFMQPPAVPKNQLERWCDVFATNVLLPRSLVESRLPSRDSPFLFESICRIAREFRVSNEACFIRLWELFRIQVAQLSVGESLVLIRSHSDAAGTAELTELLKEPRVRQYLLTTSPLIFVAFGTGNEQIAISGKRSGAKNIALAISWPPLR